ncbi:MAG: iron-containing alcohol dehydrogenase [Deltaproteobacteria bacterium]|nr:iron-containing alcohol dehydrogenase [Deltaproteobacteria bacterium]MBW2151951.1 iron-containing alcohol dehydrogenase [Deltaproteobacteria bacterium]
MPVSIGSDLARAAAANAETQTGGVMFERQAANLAPQAIRHLLKSVGLPTCLRELEVKDKASFPTWAKEAHKEQRLLSRSSRVLSVEDIQQIYEMAW